MAHHASDALVAYLLPGLGRVGFAPSSEELVVLFGQAQLVSIGNIEIGASDHAAHLLAGHRLACLEIDDHWAGAILGGLLSKPAEAIVAPVAIDLTDTGHQVMQVRFSHPVGAIVLRAIGASPFLPALALMADYELDSIDRKILSALAEAASRSYAQLDAVLKEIQTQLSNAHETTALKRTLEHPFGCSTADGG